MDLGRARDVLIKNFKSHPECADTERSARALIMDSIPKLQAEKNILITLYHEGFVDAIRDSDEIRITSRKYELILTRDYGFSENISKWCIDTWILIIAESLELKSDDEAFDEIYSNELVVVKSEFDRLMEEIRNLKALIIALTTERDELKFHECMNLAAEYNSRIGDLELQVLNAKLRVLELKRTIEILQAQINRQEKKSAKKAREQARQEYREFEEELNRKAEEACNANKYKEDETQKEEDWQKEQEEKNEDEDPTDNRIKYKSRSDEMKALYRKIVKALHPDMNPDQTPAEKELFLEAVESYNIGDIDKLREIVALIEEGKIGDNPLDVSPENIDRLREIVDGLRLRVDELQEEINQIKSSFPYTMKEFLNDEEAVNAKQKELTGLLYEYDKQVEELEKRLAEMLGKRRSDGA